MQARAGRGTPLFAIDRRSQRGQESGRRDTPKASNSRQQLKPIVRIRWLRRWQRQARHSSTGSGRLFFDEQLCFRTPGAWRWAFTPIIREMARSTINDPQALMGQRKTDIIEDVRSAIARNDLLRAKRLEQTFRAKNGPTLEALEALSWLARGTLNAGRVREAVAFAQQAHRLATHRAKRLVLDEEPPFANGAWHFDRGLGTSNGTAGGPHPGSTVSEGAV